MSDRNYSNFDIAGAFQQIFGYRPPDNYVIPANTANPQKQSGMGLILPNKPAQAITTLTGAPIKAQDVEFKRDYFLPVILANNYLPFPVISVEQDKHIVETMLTEQRGTVNEIISSGDIRITIKGIIYRPDGNFPEQEIALLNNLFLQQRSLPIQNAITDIVLQTDGGQAYTDVIITRFRILPSVGKTIGYRAYEMELKSDFVQELEVLD